VPKILTFEKSQLFDIIEFCHDAADKMNFSAFTAPKFGFLLIYSYLCRQLLLIVMRWTAIIYEVCGNHIVF
jgi:hypothetical protein